MLKTHHFCYIKDRQLLQTFTIFCAKVGCLFYLVLLKSFSCSVPGKLMTHAEESEMVLRWFAPFTSVNAAVTYIFKQIKKKKKFLSEEWYPNIADGSFLCTSIRALRMMGVMFLSSSALGACLFFSATQKAGNTKDYNELLENSS